MALGDTITAIKAAVARGSSLDAEIPSYLARAARWIEREYNLPHMERSGTFVADSTVEDPRRIEIPTTRMKADRWIYRVDGEGERFQLHKINPQDIRDPENSDDPWAYWIEGTAYFMLNRTPKTGETYSIGWWEYSAWPVKSTETHWFIEHFEDLLIAQTMVLMAPRLRDQKLTQHWRLSRDEQIKTLADWLDDWYHNNEANCMEYSPYTYP